MPVGPALPFGLACASVLGEAVTGIGGYLHCKPVRRLARFFFISEMKVAPLASSSLLMLVSAFAAPGRTTGVDLVLRAYVEAIRQRYRFFSYGDAMLLI